MIPILKAFQRTAFQSFLSLAVVAACTLAPLFAFAEDVTEVDARLEGYYPPVILKDASGTGMTIVLLVLLIGLTMGFMFMNAKRSHLD